ncbi:hypothetical protein Vadar_016219 [Vaccinium darrowii]|uniref:Uncharacterized protein n=1 Tax=Vaccinium darrowii TaxID=229202 RepID=A0ACB7YN76_9ERIC|nr:hypothetical protein Vadar_016219 [Vaccinium darrowii]
MDSSSIFQSNSKLSFSIFESSEGEKRWIDQIRKILDKEVKVPIDPVSIFRVPATLSISKREAYVPQVVALGPYHHFRPELYEMERYKLAAAIRLQKELKSLEIEKLVLDLNREFEQKVRACYHKYLDFEEVTLAWVMAIDGIFLLDFLHRYNLSPSTYTAHLVDSTGRPLANGSVLRDILMLENQIPIFVLSKILSIQRESLPELANNGLPDLRRTLMDFCGSLSPLKIKDDPTLFDVEVSEAAHLLDFLYQLIVPKPPKLENLGSCRDPMNTEDKNSATNIDHHSISFLDTSKFFEVISKLWQMISTLNVRIIQRIARPLKLLVAVSSSVSGTPGLKSQAPTDTASTGKPENAIEEIHIPSVTQLCNVGVVFRSATGGIEAVGFNRQTKVFTLPVIHLDVDSEVVMRNLVAYETAINPESLVFTRYMELMSGIVDTVEDARLLKKNKIIDSKLKSDADVALFNGMSKSVRLTKVPHIDRTIKDVNAYYDSTMAVRMYKRAKNFVYHSWKLLTLLAVVLLMFLTGVQSFCSVYVCNKVFRNIDQG